MADNRVVVEGSSVTAHQLMEFFRQVGDGLITRTNFQEFLDRLGATLRGLIKKGRYDLLSGFAEKPEDIKGQTYDPAAHDCELAHPGEVLTTEKVYNRFCDRMATLSDLLRWGMDHPDDQLEFPIGVVWQDETGQFWYAILNSDGANRNLNVDQVPPDAQWFDNARFLLRKSARKA